MSKINCRELVFDHIVEFVKDSTIFAAARENGEERMCLFLINESTGQVYTRNGRLDSWEELFGSDRNAILDLLSTACRNHTPVYRVNGANG